VLDEERGRFRGRAADMVKGGGRRLRVRVNPKLRLGGVREGLMRGRVREKAK